MAGKIIKYTVTIKDKEGNVVTTATSSKEIPSFDEFAKLGFREAFHQLENAVLETSEKATTLATEQYLSKGSKNNLIETKSRITPEGGEVIESIIPSCQELARWR